MFSLPALPEIGFGSKTICDICMRKQSTKYYDCGSHKMCSSCYNRFASMETCPLCTKMNQRYIEKSLGKSCAPQSLPVPCSFDFEPLHTIHNDEDDFIITPNTSDSSLSLSSEISSDGDDVCSLPFDCNDMFAAIDAQFEREQMFQSNVSYNGLCHCSCSVYEDFFKKDFCPSDDQLKNMLLPSPSSTVINAAYVSYGQPCEQPRRTLSKSNHLSNSEFQRMIELCKDL